MNDNGKQSKGSGTKKLNEKQPRANILVSAAMAFSCFSKIPMPTVKWEESSMKYAMCFFPFIGIVVGLLWFLWCWVCQQVHFNNLFLGVGVFAISVLVTGGIHLDGFIDVCDAHSSHAEPARKREILHDPHVGAFAIIGCVTYALVFCTAASECGASICWLGLACIPIISRCESATANLLFKRSSKEGMLAMFGNSAEVKRSFAVIAVELIAACLIMVGAPLLGFTPGDANIALLHLAMIVISFVCLFGVRAFANKQFGGMSGDLAGFFLQVCELCMLLVLAVGVKLLLL